MGAAGGHQFHDQRAQGLGDRCPTGPEAQVHVVGAVGSIPAVGADPWLIPDDASWAILLDDSRFAKFRAAIEKQPDLTHVWLVTTSEEAFARMRVQLSLDLRVSMLYRDYLRTFEINTEQP